MRNGLAVTGKIRNAATCAVYVSSRSFPRLDACVCIQPTIIHNPPPVRGGYGRLEATRLQEEEEEGRENFLKLRVKPPLKRPLRFNFLKSSKGSGVIIRGLFVDK